MAYLDVARSGAGDPELQLESEAEAAWAPCGARQEAVTARWRGPCRTALVLTGLVGMVALVVILGQPPSRAQYDAEDGHRGTEESWLGHAIRFYRPQILGSNVTYRTPCHHNEELFENLCYTKCSIASYGKYNERAAGCTCKNAHGTLYTDCPRYNTDGHGGMPRSPRPSDPMGSCFSNEENFGGFCYKKCSLLTEGRYPYRTGTTSCSNGKTGGNWNVGILACNGFGVGGGGGCPGWPGKDENSIPENLVDNGDRR